MANIRIIKDQAKCSTGSPKGEVGEIDTRAPFQSVKAAVSLFGEVAVSSKDKRTLTRKPSKLSTSSSSENVLDKEMQLLLAQKDLHKLKQQLQSAESTKSRAFSELQMAKRTQEDLTTKLRSVNESKQSAIEAAEAVKTQASNIPEPDNAAAAWKLELDHARTEYAIIVGELNASKQELTKIRQDFDAALESKTAAFQQAAEAQRAANLNHERAGELSQQIAAMQQSVEDLNLAAMEAREEQVKLLSEKEACFKDYKAAMEEAEKSLTTLRHELDPRLTVTLEESLKQTTAEIEVLKKARAFEMDTTVRAVLSELNEATHTLQQLTEEEISMRELVSSLKLELENVKIEREELNNKLEEEEKMVKSWREQSAKVQQLTAENEAVKAEIELMKREADELKREAEENRSFTEGGERKLANIQKDIEEAKATEKRAVEEMKIMAGQQEAAPAAASASSSQIKLTVEEFESLSKRVRESEIFAEKEEAMTTAEVEVINARRNEAVKKVEANLTAIEEIKTATEMALRGAEMAESAKMVVEGELRRRREKEQTAAAQVTSGHIYF